MNDKKYNGRVTVMALSTAKVSRRRERALMRFEGKLAGMERSKLQKLGRVSSVNITSIRVWRCDTSTGGGGKIGEARMMSPIIPWNTWAPVLRYTSVSSPPVRKCMKTSTHSLRVVGVGVAAKLHDLGVLSALKLFPANRKNSPTSPLSSPQGFHGFLHRYIFSVNAPRGSLFQPHHEYTELSLIRYVNATLLFF